MSDVYNKIHYNYEKLSKTEQEVIDFMLNVEDAGKLKLKDIKDNLFISNATIYRACKKLNYGTFNELKYAFARLKNEQQFQRTADSDFLQILDGIKQDTVVTLEQVDEKNIKQICNCLLESRRIFCIGTGVSSEVASEFNRNLKLIDCWTNVYSEECLIERIPQISTKQDVIIVFIVDDQFEKINKSIIEAKENGTKIITVTNVVSEQLDSISTYTLKSYSSQENPKKLRPLLMLNVMSTLIYETLMMKVPSLS